MEMIFYFIGFGNGYVCFVGLEVKFHVFFENVVLGYEKILALEN